MLNALLMGEIMKNIKLLVILSSLVFSLIVVSQEAVLEELVVTALKR